MYLIRIRAVKSFVRNLLSVLTILIRICHRCRMKTTLGEAIRKAREGMTWTQGDLAKRMGVKIQTVSGWENDLHGMRMDHWRLLSKLLGIPADKILAA